MEHRPRPPEQDDLLLCPRLVDLIDLHHGLVKLAAPMDWEFFEQEWAGFFPSATGRPATSPQLLYLQNAFRLSDEAVVARWVENPRYQHFTGEIFVQHRPPIDPTSLTRWRKRIGEEGVEWLLTKSIEAGRASGAVADRSLDQVAVDTTVMEKAIAHPTGSCRDVLAEGIEVPTSSGSRCSPRSTQFQCVRQTYGPPRRRVVSWSLA